jgi:hypothetical protein
MLITTAHTNNFGDFASRDRTRIQSMRNFIRSEFVESFRRKGYTQGAPGPLIPEHDSSVLFTGSATNTMKPFLLGEPIPGGRLHILQTCLRTQNTRTIGDLQHRPGWASYFSVLGAITAPMHLDALAEHSWSFFTESLGIPPNSLRIHIASKDTDLCRFWKRAGLIAHLEFDTRPPEYYTHKYGLNGIAGRNYNFAIVDSQTGEARDIGNLIIIEGPTGAIATEIGFGVETTASRLFSLSSAVEAALIADIIPVTDNASLKFADALSASIAILDTGIVRPTSRAGDHRGSTLKRYLQAMIELRPRTGFTVAQVRDFSESFETLEFGAPSVVSLKIEEYLATHDRLKVQCFREEKFNEVMNGIIRPLTEAMGHKPRKSLSGS